MTSRCLIPTVLVLAALLSSCSDDETMFGPAPEDTVTYRVTFAGTWSAATHPDSFPVNPHFSRLIGATHCPCVTFWEPGELASTGIKDMAERGITTSMTTEIEAAQADSSAQFLLAGDGISVSSGSVSLDFEVSLDYPRVTLVSMVAPSPDWFVGVAGLALFDGSDWADSLEVVLYPYDAGTDSGTNYTSPNAATQPPTGIALIDSGPLWIGDDLPPVGTFTFVRQ